MVSKQSYDEMNVVFKFIVQTKEFVRGLATPMDRFKKMNNRMREMRFQGGKLAIGLRRITHGMRGFRMEMLGVLFFGLAMKRFFTGLIRPALELVGIFDLWRVTLQVLFLPIALALLEILLPFFEWIMNLSDGTKLLIGKFVLFGIGLGILLFLVGMLALGIGAIIMAFTGFLNLIDRLIPDVSIFGVKLDDFLVSLIGLKAGATVINLLKKGWEKLKDIFSPLMDKFKELDIVNEILSKMGIEVKEGETVWDAFKNKITSVITEIASQLGIGEDDVNSFKTEFTTAIDDMKTKAETLTNTLKDDFLPQITKLSETISDIDMASLNTALKEFGDFLHIVNIPLKIFADVAERIDSVLDRINNKLQRTSKSRGSSIGPITISSVVNAQMNPIFTLSVMSDLARLIGSQIKDQLNSQIRSY